MHIRQEEIKFNSKLYLDYIENFSNLSGFFNYNPSDTKSFSKRYKDLINKEISPAIRDILFNQNKEIGNFNTAKKCLPESNKISAIITGQQNGVFGGPLYTLYKILTAKKLSEYLKTQLNINVPVIFWSESDDHDFNEIAQINLYDKKNIPVNINIESDKKGLPVGKININSEIDNAINFLKQNLPETDFSDTLFSAVEKYYKKSETYSSAFLKFLSNVLNKYGILYFNPNLDEVKQYTKEFFRKTIKNKEQIYNSLKKSSSDLIKSGYFNQVKITEENSNIFISNPERKHLKYNSKEYSQLHDIIDNNPEYLSTNVLLRPIYQDYIFPDLAYVAGPSEIAYFAQIGNLYPVYGLEMPVIFPRNTFTILNRHSSKLLNDNFNFTDVFEQEREILKRLNLKEKLNNIEKVFENSEEKIKQEFDKLIDYSDKIDSSISDSLKFSSRKTGQKLKEIREKAVYTVNKKDERLVNDVKKFKEYLLPFGKLQERTISLVNFLARYGFDFPDKIYEKIELFNFDHKLLDLK